LDNFLADVLDFSTGLCYNNRRKKMTIKEEILADSKSFVVESNEGLHEILFAQEEIKWDMPMFLVGFDNGGTIMQKGLYFEENGLAVGYHAGVPYKIIRRTDATSNTEGNDGLSGGSEGVDDNPETEVATIEGGTTDPA
jgi:hypothetical protein